MTEAEANRLSVSPTPSIHREKRGRPRSRGRLGFGRLRREAVDADARRLCAVVLEVLSGVRTPTAAAGILSVSVPRYYALESRALEGMLKACQKRSRGPRRTAEREAARLKAEVERLEREGARLGALLRAAQRAVGLPAPEDPKRRPKESVPGKRRKRRPVVRALKAAKAIREEEVVTLPAEKESEPARA